ncbi:MAG TPA: hypothetical protein VGM84_19665 [Steroidobacteraceae bacterium]
MVTLILAVLAAVATAQIALLLVVALLLATVHKDALLGVTRRLNRTFWIYLVIASVPCGMAGGKVAAWIGGGHTAVLAIALLCFLMPALPLRPHALNLASPFVGPILGVAMAAGVCLAL